MPKDCVLGPFGSIFDQKTAKKEQTSECHKIFASAWIFDLSQKSNHFRPGEWPVFLKPRHFDI